MVPKDWKTLSLGEITKEKISYGIVQAGPHVENGVPYIKSSNVGGEIKIEDLQRTSSEIHHKYRRSAVHPNDIVFSLRGNIGIQEQSDTTSFDNLLGKSMTLLNETQLASDAATQSLIMGDGENLHDIMIKATEAQLALDLAVQVRNKSLEAFNEIKNMQF